MQRKARFTFAAALVLVALAMTTSAQAFSNYLNDFHTAYPSAAGSAIDICRPPEPLVTSLKDGRMPSGG